MELRPSVTLTATGSSLPVDSRCFSGSSNQFRQDWPKPICRIEEAFCLRCRQWKTVSIFSSHPRNHSSAVIVMKVWQTCLGRGQRVACSHRVGSAPTREAQLRLQKSYQFQVQKTNPKTSLLYLLVLIMKIFPFLLC